MQTGGISGHLPIDTYSVPHLQRKIHPLAQKIFIFINFSVYYKFNTIHIRANSHSQALPIYDIIGDDF